MTRIRVLHRTSILDFLAGTPYITWYFRLLGSKIGKDCCLYPAGGDPYMPEPDLVTIGDRCVIDLASVVNHLNTRGNFELVTIKIDDDVTLRSRSRIQQGVHVEAGAMLLEKSLALTGEVIEADSVWQGAPASTAFGYERSQGVTPSISFDNRRGLVEYSQII
jgi:acetyltransferase-like isoleucine patch superfamily enzyme